jgi:ribonuclease P protein subunit POP4
MNEENIVKEEFIGKHVRIKESTDPNWLNKSGLIIDETKNTFLIEIKNKKKRITKKTATFEFEYMGKKIKIKGSRLNFRPEDRIKKSR